jgi:hypothetical protein
MAAAEAEKKALCDAALDRRKEIDRIGKLGNALRPLQDRWQSLRSTLAALPAPPAANIRNVFNDTDIGTTP